MLKCSEKINRCWCGKPCFCNEVYVTFSFHSPKDAHSSVWGTTNWKTYSIHLFTAVGIRNVLTHTALKFILSVWEQCYSVLKLFRFVLTLIKDCRNTHLQVQVLHREEIVTYQQYLKYQKKKYSYCRVAPFQSVKLLYIEYYIIGILLQMQMSAAF